MDGSRQWKRKAENLFLKTVLGLTKSSSSAASTAVGKGANGTFARRQALVLVLTISSFQRRWNSKAESLSTKDVVRKVSRNNDVTNFINDLQKMVPNEIRKRPNRDKTRELADQNVRQYVV